MDSEMDPPADLDALLKDMDVIKMLEAYQSSGGNAFGEMPDELQELLKNVQRAKGEPTGDTEAEYITPEPGFVVKTNDQNDQKVFINICHSKQVPAPGGWTNGRMPDKVLQALEAVQQDEPLTEALRFPISCSEVQVDTDKQGQPCSTIDCIIHSDVLAAAQHQRPLKAYLIGLALEWVGNKYKMELNPKFKLPKMAYKGSEVRPQRVRLDRQPLVTDVTSQQLQDEAPSFPLLPSKPKAALAKAASKAGIKQAAAAGSSNNSSSGAAVAPSSSSSGAAAGPNCSSSSSWQCDVKCDGQPVSHMVVTVQLPPRSAGSSNNNSSSSWSAADISAKVCGQQLRVRAAAQGDPCVVQLPFAAASQGAGALLQPSTGQLLVRLPYLPVQQWVQQLVEASPHAFTKLPVAHAAYMELDEVE